MTMRQFVAAALLATLVGCGGSGSASSTSSLSGGDTSDPSDGGTTETCDCTGLALPDICMVCSDGQAACAHFVCVSGMCETQLCP